MPAFTYECKKCKVTTSKIVRDNKVKIYCSKCKEEMKRLFPKNTSFVFKNPQFH